MMRSNVTNPQTVYKEENASKDPEQAEAKREGLDLVLQDVVRARTHARALDCQEIPDAGWLRDGGRRASLLLTSTLMPGSLLNKKEERRSKQSQFYRFFSFPLNYIILYFIVLYCTRIYFSSPFLRHAV
jgi:hypothetical protein